MKYCPNCRAEYLDDVAECHDCQVPLVDELPEESREEWEHVEPVVVHTASAVIDAELIVATLRASEVRAFYAGTGGEFFSDAGQIGQMTRIPGPLNEIRILVHPDDEERAREVLAAADEAAAEEMAADPEETLPATRWTLDQAKRKTAIRVVAVLVLAPILWVIVLGIMEGLRNL